MGKVAIVTDSTSGLTQADMQAYPNLVVVPETVTFGGKTYREGLDIDNHTFYTQLAQMKQLPTTAPPTTEYMKERYDELAEQGYTAVISIHLTVGITGFLPNLAMALKDYDRIPVTLVDSYITAMPMGYMARVAATMAAAGAEVTDIMTELDYLRTDVGSYFMVADLKNLVKGGRLKNSAAVVGTMLQVRPILSMINDKHEIRAVDKVRTQKRAVAYLEEKLAEEIQHHHPRVFLMGTNNQTEVANWYNELAPQYPDIIFETFDITPVVGTHIGSNTLAVTWTPESHIAVPVLNRL
ncbi:DegV family protein [Lacticaseibacillus brantae]|uniref:DegV family protein n=1 Tax=Lacticaseibacillus brantae DSM 23927 TaxID=1423727 RepID=A0A0R2B823_9LACO|nr:DegV family protein [Lacticaseibacillus brantae]KRM71660.1 degV family protein [Lacticaseibacillus brantae DSM 23927]